MPKTADEYLSLPFTTILRRDSRENIYVARVEELPGCSAHGETEQEALANLHDNMKVWVEDCLESGDPVPEPVQEVELPSGKWVQRVPRTVHLKLIRLAKKEGVSLNQLVASTLAEAVGSREMKSIALSCFETNYRGSFHADFGWNQCLVETNQCAFDIAPAQTSSASAIYVQQLANTVSLVTTDVVHKGRTTSYGQRSKPLVTAGR